MSMGPNFQQCLEGLLIFWRECRSLDNIKIKVKEYLESSTPARIIPGLNFIKSRSIQVEEGALIQITSPGMLLLNFPDDSTDGITPCLSDGTLVDPLSLGTNYLKKGMIPVIANDYFKSSISTVDTKYVTFIPYKDLTY